jgi:predicted AAA+ superfamily ATPase
VKTPKVYVADPGILHTLLDISSAGALDLHPKVGASFEGFALQAVVRAAGARPEQCYFWATHQGAELDLLLVQGALRRGFEFKRTDAPTVTRSMRIAIEDLGLDSLDVIHVGPDTFPLALRIRAVAVSRITADVLPPRQGGAGRARHLPPPRDDPD